MTKLADQLRITPTEPAETQIERHFRFQIQSGKLTGNARLPATSVLASTLRVSCTAVQRAMNRLVADGLIQRRPKKGTYVNGMVDTTTIAIVFGPHLTHETAHFFRAVKNAFMQEIEGRNWRGRIYDGLNDEHGQAMTANSHVCRHLADDLGRYAFDGLVVFGTNIEEIAPLKRVAGLPYVHTETTNTAHDVVMDGAAFARESLEYLAGKGYKRIAYLRSAPGRGRETSDLDTIRTAWRELGLIEPAVEFLSTSPTGPAREVDYYRSALRLIAQWRAAGADAWPQAILVSEDIAMRAVALALLKSGVSVPQDVFVMTQACAEVDLHYGMPVARYEFSAQEIARQFLELLGKRIQGEALPPLPVVVKGKIREAEIETQARPVTGAPQMKIEGRQEI